MNIIYRFKIKHIIFNYVQPKTVNIS